MKCTKCGAEFDEGFFCPECGTKIEMEDFSDDLKSEEKQEKMERVEVDSEQDASDSGKQEIIRHIESKSENSQKADESKAKVADEEKLPWYLSIWFILVISVLTFWIFWIPGIVLGIMRFVICKKKRVSAIAVVAMLLSPYAISIFLFVSSIRTENQIDAYIENGQYEDAREYIEKEYSVGSSSYADKYAKLYTAQGMYDEAVDVLVEYCNNEYEPINIPDYRIGELNKLVEQYKNELRPETLKKVQDLINNKEIAEAEKKAAKEAAEREVEEKAAKEAAEREAEEKAAKEAAEKEVEEKAAKEAEEKTAKEVAEKNIIQNAQTLGVDLVMESHSSSFEDKYFKTEGTIEEVDETSAYLIRYLSTVDNHKRMCKAWITTNDTSGLYVGENIFVVAKYVGFAKDSSVPTLEQYKIDKSSSSFYSTLSKKAKVVNRDVSFEDLLRYGEYQEYIYVEGTVTNVFDTCINVKDEYGNLYLIFDDRVNQTVILQDDFVRIYGEFEGISRDGYVWPEISWLVDGNQE